MVITERFCGEQRTGKGSLRHRRETVAVPDKAIAQRAARLRRFKRSESVSGSYDFLPNGFNREDECGDECEHAQPQQNVGHDGISSVLFCVFGLPTSNVSVLVFPSV